MARELGTHQVPVLVSYLMSELRVKARSAKPQAIAVSSTSAKVAPGRMQMVEKTFADTKGVADALQMVEKGIAYDAIAKPAAPVIAHMDERSRIVTAEATMAEGAPAKPLTQYGQTSGWIWLGDYAEKAIGSVASGWKRLNVRPGRDAGAPGHPNAIVNGQRFTLDKNVFVREKFPDPKLCTEPYSSRAYSSCVRDIGLATIGQQVEIVGTPQKVGVGNRIQYWAKVKILE
jgi:hypothetical protein